METYVVPKYSAATGAGTFSGIAREKGLTMDELLSANPQYKSNPNLLKEGVVLSIPTKQVAPPAPVNNNPNPTASDIQAQIDSKTAEIDKLKRQINKNNTAEAAGVAGLSIDDFTKYLLDTGVTQTEADKIKKDIGLTDLEAKTFIPPEKTTEQLYTDAYANAGLADVKTQIKNLLDEISTRQDQLNQRLLKIDENPWLSEASRSKSVTRETDFMNRAIGNLNNKLNALTTVYNSGISEINGFISRSTTDFHQTQNLNQAKLAYLEKKAETLYDQKRAEKSGEISQYLPSYLKGKVSSTKPETIGTAETGFYRWDPQQGKFVQVISGTGKKLSDSQQKQDDIKSMSSTIATWTGPDGFISPKKYQELKAKWINDGGYSAKDFDDAFGIYRNPDDEYNLNK